ncbi:MAG: energy transducer TonB [Sphingobacteriaceae bacterium]|nr:energy transducer TonB [Sphingobacteriaceae bacterium]
MEPKKNPKADLNKQRGLFFQVGMITSLGLMLTAFNWAQREGGAGDLGTLVIEEPVEVEIPQTEQKVQPPPPPPPPVLEVVEDDELVEEDDIQSTEVTQDTKIDIPVIEPEEGPSEPEIFTVVEEMPTFPGGDQALLEYMAKNTKYPPLARENGLQGIVVVTFVVDEKGNINNVQVLRGIGGGCDEEAIRVVKSMPAWKPGKQRGMPVRVQYNLPFRFTLR